MATFQNAKLADIQYIPVTAASVYANPSGTITFIKGLILHNTNTTTEVVKVYNVPDSSGVLGVAGNNNIFLEVNLASKETFNYSFPYPIVLADINDSLFASTTTVSRVTLQILGDRGI